jgi:hypothetical protein
MRQGLIPTCNPVEERLLHQGISDNRQRRVPATGDSSYSRPRERLP